MATMTPQDDDEITRQLDAEQADAMSPRPLPTVTPPPPGPQIATPDVGVSATPGTQGTPSAGVIANQPSISAVPGTQGLAPDPNVLANTPAISAEPGTQGAQPGAADTLAYPSTLPPATPTPAAESEQGQTEMAQMLAQFAQQGMANPSRYDSEIFQQGLDLFNREAEQARDRAHASLDESASARGLVGSSIEANAQAQAEAQIENARLGRLFELSMAQADRYADDRNAAASIGFQSGDFLRQLGQDQTQASQFGQVMSQREREFAAQHGLNEQQFRAQQQQFSATMAEQIAGRLQQGEQYAAALAQDQQFRQFAADAQMRGLDLQEAAQEWQQTYGNRQQDLQEQGLDDDYQLRLTQTLINALGADIDPEALQAIIAQFFAQNPDGGGPNNEGGAKPENREPDDNPNQERRQPAGSSSQTGVPGGNLPSGSSSQAVGGVGGGLSQEDLAALFQQLQAMGV